MSRSINSIHWFFVATIAVAYPLSGIAAEYTGQIRAGIGVSDNVTRVDGGEIDETIATAGFDLRITEQSRTVDLALRASVDYLDYLDDTYDAEWVGGLDGNVSLSLIEERLRWVIQDRFGQQLFDPFQPARPDNREDVNFFTTGPVLNLFPASRNDVRIEARYGRVDYEERPSDNDRLEGKLMVGRSMAPDSKVSLNFTGRRVEYDESAFAPPIESYAGSLRIERTGSRTSVGFEAGYNELEYAGFSGDGLLLGFDWSRETSANGRVSVSAGSRYSDQGDIFQLQQGLSPSLGETIDDPDSVAPFRDNYFSLRYGLETDRQSIETSLNLRQEDYQGGTGADRDFYTGRFTMRRNLSRTVYTRARAQLTRRDYKYEDRRDDDLVLGLSLGYRFLPGFDVSVEYVLAQRNSTSAGADYSENRAFLRLAYTPRWSRQGSD